MSKKPQSYLLNKTELGEVKKGFHDLPPAGHTYGKAPEKDKYGARQVISNWNLPVKSNPTEGGKDYVAMNRQGIKNGCIDSKQITNFRKDNEIKIKIKEGQRVYGVSIPDEQFAYGVPNKPSTPMKNVICNSYALEQQRLKQQREAVLKLLEKDSNKRSIPKVEVSPKQKAKVDLEANRKKQIESHNFKLSKFKDVPSKIKPLMEKKSSKAH